MAGEILKTTGICLAIHPWSRTSHVVRWLTPDGPLTTLVKGAVRPKSAFLGQYDLNYTCEILYYARARGEIHALRECTPQKMREHLRGEYRALVLAEYFRKLAGDLSPSGTDAKPFFELLESRLDTIRPEIGELIDFEVEILKELGLDPESEAAEGELFLRGDRKIPVSKEVAECIRDPKKTKDPQILLDAARVISVLYTFHLDYTPESRRTVLGMISKK